MSDRELDEILNEIKQNKEPVAEPQPEVSQAPAVPTEPEVTPVTDEPQVPAEPVVTESPETPEGGAIPVGTVAPEAENADEVDLLTLAERQEEPLRINDFKPAPASEEKKPNTKKIIIIVLAVLVAVAAGVGIYFGFFHDKEEPETTVPVSQETTTEEPLVVTQPSGALVNPLTGDPDFNREALGKRPVAVVVENEYGTASVKPQWGMETADIVMEGETEYSTRMLFFWADMTQLPDQIGPVRSARPPFIHFSQLFDAIFLHAGLSHSKDNYEGADEVFEKENIDHVNLLIFQENGYYFGRDKSRTKTIEHTGYLNGKNTARMINKLQMRTALQESRFTQFNFNEEAAPVGDKKAESLTLKWSNRCPKTGKFTYDAEKKVYTTTDFDSKFGEANLGFTNLLVLMDKTEYIVKENYKGTGNSETYCNYELDGGKGVLLSQGTYTEIKWSVKKGKLVIKGEDGKEVKFNPGKTYIGYGSSNHGGSYTVE